MVETDALVQQPPLQLRGSLFTLSVVQLHETDAAKIDRELHKIVKQAPKFFDHAPVVIDLQQLTDKNCAIDFSELSMRLRDHTLIPVGVRGGTAEHHAQARAAGLAVMSIAKQEEPTLAAGKKKSTEKTQDKTATQPAAAPSILVTKPVRSGQQIYARGGDLIVVSAVSQGAELLADGSIHIYGPLRGRALAGINGDTFARIFCHSMEAELVSIAGRYIVNETVIRHENNVPQQIYLDEGKLIIAPLYVP